MKTILPFLSIIALACGASAGDTVVTPRTSARVSGESCSGTQERSSSRARRAGTDGAFYRSNFFRNAVICINDTSDFMTFFVYFGDLTGPNSVNKMVRDGAHVYEVVVPPYTTRFTDQRARHYWVCSKRGKWGIDPAKNRISPS